MTLLHPFAARSGPSCVATVTTAPTTTSPTQCTDETGRAIDTGKRCVDTPVEPGASVAICEDGTPCPTVAAAVATTEAPRELPATGVGFDIDGLGLALVLFGAVLARAVRRPA